jgi:carboxypeptidase Taq
MCAGVPEDVRITNRFNEADVMSAIMGVVHETGHAKYEQNRPREWLSQPVSQARSMGVHESQSLLHEMQMARSPAFIKHLRGKLLESFDDEPAFEHSNLVRISQSVRPGKIRVDADELTYPLHVLLRYEIESAVVGGSMQVSDIPAYWERKMQEYLGVDVKGDFKNGCLQDIHWPVGLIGYFPTYTLGAMFAARFMHALRRDLGAAEIDAAMEQGNFEAVSKWLNERVWSKGSILETHELIRTATGDDDVPTSEFYRRHLTERYGPK